MKRAWIGLAVALAVLCLAVGCKKEPEAKKQFVVTFDFNGGTYRESSVEKETVEAGKTVSEPVHSPVKTYYKFVGWTKEKDGSTLFDFEKETITSDITLYAKYEALYTVGGKGPNGGYIIYENPSYNATSTWKYLEVAEKDFSAVVSGADAKSFAWGAAEAVSTETTIGSGASNTEKMSKLSSSVAKEVWKKTYIGGNTDWFIPSKAELEQVYKVVKEKGLSGFDGTYWSSSAVDTNQAYAVTFGTGGEDAATAATAKARTETYKLRLVRAF